jgi:hypothetical protein
LVIEEVGSIIKRLILTDLGVAVSVRYYERFGNSGKKGEQEADGSRR